MAGSKERIPDAYSVALGSVMRDLRLRAGLSGDAFLGAITRTNLYLFESGRAQVKIGTLVHLCEVLGLSPSQVLLIVEARLAGLPLAEFMATSTADFTLAMETGLFEPASADEAVRGLKGQRSDQLRQSVLDAQASGDSKAEVARKLGVSTRTVTRYWQKG